MSTTGVLVSGRQRRRRVSAASLGRFAGVARDPQSYRNVLYLLLATLFALRAMAAVERTLARRLLRISREHRPPRSNVTNSRRLNTTNSRRRRMNGRRMNRHRSRLLPSRWRCANTHLPKCRPNNPAAVRPCANRRRCSHPDR